MDSFVDESSLLPSGRWGLHRSRVTGNVRGIEARLKSPVISPEKRAKLLAQLRQLKEVVLPRSDREQPFF